MRILLAALMCYVLVTAQASAISGGPVYPAGTSVTGTYAGVLEPRFDPTDPFSSNSLGIFSLGVPATGLASGSFVMFVRGTVFKGTIQGLGNPNKGTITGILDAAFTVSTNQSTITDSFGFVFTSSSNTVTARAQGNLNAKVLGTSTGRATSATLLKGSANLFVSQTNSASPTPTPPGGTTPPSGGSGVTAAFSLDVSGFKQSTTAVPTSATSGSP
ncbi:MAG: hypothetical protein M3Y86_04145 [Verrucomicrobiota bacterium]|nr:hypothetical protein [Verrucomicrobiota bacterium]